MSWPGAANSAAEAPGALRTETLLVEVQPPGHPTALLRSDIAEGRDFTVVAEPVWRLLLAWYGGGPPICRPAVADGGVGGRPVEVSLELTLLKLLVHVDADAPPPAPLELHVSRADTVRKLAETACVSLSLLPDAVRLWDYFDERRHVLLAEPDRRLAGLKLVAGQAVLLEAALLELLLQHGHGHPAGGLGRHGARGGSRRDLNARANDATID